MAGLNTWVTELTAAQGRALRRLLMEAGYAFRDVDHAVFGAKGEGVNVVLYRSGKLVIQGRGQEAFRQERLIDVIGLPKPRLTAPLIGCDEAGKGDYFGPLVVAACALRPEEEPFLPLSPGDSKLMSDVGVRNAAEAIRPVLAHEIISISPKRYNELYESFRNLNQLLAWAHAKAMTALSDRTGIRDVLLDRFAAESVVLRALGRTEIDLRQETKAESNPAVGAASILARAAFLEGLEALSRETGLKLAKGAGDPVLRAGRAIVREHGRGALDDVAKLHFATTRQLG